VSIGGRDRDEALAIFEHCRSSLNFVLNRVDEQLAAPLLKVASG